MWTKKSLSFTAESTKKYITAAQLK